MAREFWTEAGRGGQAFSWTAFAPEWPHDGGAGTVLYVTAYATRGWQVLERQPSGRSAIRSITLTEALRLLPEDLRPAALEAQAGIEEAARVSAQKWLDRLARYRSERRDAEESVAGTV